MPPGPQPDSGGASGPIPSEPPTPPSSTAVPTGWRGFSCRSRDSPQPPGQMVDVACTKPLPPALGKHRLSLVIMSNNHTALIEGLVFTETVLGGPGPTAWEGAGQGISPGTLLRVPPGA